ncbi:hypothetical protein [Singulisphaera sp. PoT]|uniref:hypothetical protein n=1 Tax=Singulisphaera sp. PoT TaxID=3411797 RepID=UPI003BF4627C
MVRQGPLVSLASLCLALGLSTLPLIGAEPTPAAVPPPASAPTAAAPTPATAPSPSPAETVPIDRRPYRIEVHFGVDPAARIDARRLELIQVAWTRLVDRFVGPPWDLKIVEGDDPIGLLELGTVTTEPLAKAGSGFDKVWILQLQMQGGRLALVGREYDVFLRRLGPLRHRVVEFPSDLPRELLRLSLDVFNPIAEIGEPAGGGVSVTVHGSSIPPASPTGQVVKTGTVFEPLRLVYQPDGSNRILKIPFTYLRAETLSSPGAHCAIVSALRDPLTKRIARKNTIYALGIKPGDLPTRLRFVTRADKAPAAGYTLTARSVPDGAPQDVGTTDRDGRVVLQPGITDGLVILRLLAGNVEPMVEVPLMLGEGTDERVIPFDPRPETVALETQLDSLRDAVLDLVARRSRLESRLKARSEGEDWTGVAEALKEFASLPPRAKYADRLAKLKEDATVEQARTKAAILTKTAQAQLSDLQALIDRYLDDEVVKAYTEALERAKEEEAEKAKAKSKATKKR